VRCVSLSAVAALSSLGPGDRGGRAPSRNPAFTGDGLCSLFSCRPAHGSASSSGIGPARPGPAGRDQRMDPRVWVRPASVGQAPGGCAANLGVRCQLYSNSRAMQAGPSFGCSVPETTGVSRRLTRGSRNNRDIASVEIPDGVSRRPAKYHPLSMRGRRPPARRRGTCVERAQSHGPRQSTPAAGVDPAREPAGQGMTRLPA
jgi:hypothetical protein